VTRQRDLTAVVAVVTGVLTVIFLFSRYPFDRRSPSLIEAIVVILIGGLAAYALWRFGREPRRWPRRWIPRWSRADAGRPVPWERIGDDVRATFARAQDEATGLHNYIGTEHLLLALVAGGGTEIAGVLADVSVEPAQVRTAVLDLLSPGDAAVSGEIGLTPRARRSLESALDEARRLHDQRVGNGHMLVGLALVGDGIASGVLRSVGLTPGRLRATIGRRRAGHPGKPD
jgi:Clp amino terminal domain, pathogenicity island component